MGGPVEPAEWSDSLMWEVRCEPDQGAATLAWVREVLVPRFRDDELVAAWNVYRSTGQPDGDRVVLVVDYAARAGDSCRDLPPPPAGMAARPPHSWVFERLGAH